MNERNSLYTVWIDCGLEGWKPVAFSNSLEGIKKEYESHVSWVMGSAPLITRRVDLVLSEAKEA